MTREELENNIEVTKYYLENEFRPNDAHYYSWGNSLMILDMLICANILRKTKLFKKYIKIAATYFESFTIDEEETDYELQKVNFHKFLFHLLKGKADYSYLRKFAEFYERYTVNNYDLNKSNIINYEEMILYLVSAKFYQKALKYCEICSKIKDVGTVAVIHKFLLIKSKNNETIQIENVRDEFGKNINRRRKHLIQYFISNAIIYFYVYFFELKEKSIVDEMLVAMIDGI
jgi:hypothetical protein